MSPSSLLRVAAALAAALLALATCADPPIPTAADPAGLGAEGPSALPSAQAGRGALAYQSECRIVSTFGNMHLIGEKVGRPDPDSASTVAVAEGGTDDTAPNLFWHEECPAGELKLEIQYTRGLGEVEDLDPGDFRLWGGTDDKGRRRWLMTYSPFVETWAGYEVGLELVGYYDDVRHVHASRVDTAIWEASQECWVYTDVSPETGVPMSCTTRKPARFP